MMAHALSLDCWPLETWNSVSTHALVSENTLALDCGSMTMSANAPTLLNESACAIDHYMGASAPTLLHAMREQCLR